MSIRVKRLGWTGILIAASVFTAPADAATLEVTVRERGGGPMARETLVLRIQSLDAPQYGGRLQRSLQLSATTDTDGRARFKDLPRGTYAVTLPRPRNRGFLPPSGNPFSPPPRVTFFEDGETLRADLELWRGTPATVYLEVPQAAYLGFAAAFRHRATGQTLSSPFQSERNAVERLLLPGIWDVSVTPRPGYLLVDVEHDRVPVPSSVVRLDLAQNPQPTYLQFTFTAPATLTGSVTEETGKPPGVQIEATLIEPGPWIEAARRRGGSVYDKVTTGVDPHTGEFEAVLPDGLWRVRPVSPWLASSTPEVADVQLTPGGVGRADFTVRLEEGGGGDPLVVSVRDPRYSHVPRAPVEVYGGQDPETALRQGKTNAYGRALLPGLEDGTYEIVAGHPDYLEGSAELELGGEQQRPYAVVQLGLGAEVRVRATGSRDEPLAGVAVTIERLGDPPEMRLQDEELLAAKMSRTVATDDSGRGALSGFYPGTYRARARLRGEVGARGLVYLGRDDETPAPEIEFDLDGNQRVEIQARLLPAVSWRASVLCDDPHWALPDTVDVRVHDPTTPLDDLDSEDAGNAALLALEKVVLGGPRQDRLIIGPLQQGVYRLAVRPTGFDRWTWAYEATDSFEAAEIQATSGDGDEPANLGDLQVECGPAVDVLPAVLTGPAPFPEVYDVDAAARVLDREGERELGPTPLLHRRRDRLEVRGLPRGPLRLEFELTHPHLLPTPTQSWRIDLELERGQYRQVLAQVEAVGGAVRVDGAGVTARLYDAGGELREASFASDKVEIPSLVPGHYRLQVLDAAGEIVQEWPEVEIRAGETLRLVLGEHDA